MKYTIIIFFTFLSFNLFACQCFPRTLEEDIRINNYIFSGKLISQKGFINTIVVTNVWRGELNDTITLKLGTTSCHKMKLEFSKEYLIFLEDLKHGIHNCSRTTELKFSQDIDQLNEVFKGTKHINKDCLSNNEINYFNNVLANSNLPEITDLYNDSIYILFGWPKNGLKVMSIPEFIKFDHYGMIPLLIDLKSDDNRYKLYAFGYWNMDYIIPEKYLRKFKKEFIKNGGT